MSTGPAAPDADLGGVQGTVLDDESGVSRSYAQALVNAADHDGQAEAVLGDLDELIEDVWRGQLRFAAMLTSPGVRTPDKDRILDETFGGRAAPTLVQFLKVLNHRGRLDLLEPIAREARAIWDRRQNRRPVSVWSAVPLDEGQQAALREHLARMTGATPIVRLTVDPALIGGLVVQVGDDVYDASVRAHLEQLRRSLIEGKTHEIQSRRDHFSHPA